MLVITLTFVLHNPVVDGSCQGTPNPGEVTHQAAQTYGDTDKHGKEGFHSTHVKVVLLAYFFVTCKFNSIFRV